MRLKKRSSAEVEVVDSSTALATTEEESNSIVKVTSQFYKNIDWDTVRSTCRTGVNNTGLVISTIGTVMEDFGNFLRNV